MHARRTTIAALLLALTVITKTGAIASDSCHLTFQVVADNAIGSIAAGDRLRGSVQFTISSARQSDEETFSYMTNGTMTLSAPGQGSVNGLVDVVHVVRSPYIADYIAIDATTVTGDLGGESRYVDPMLIRLYGPVETLTSYDLPTTNAEWNVLTQRRVFQVYAPTTADTFNGPIEQLTGTCS